jgi:hypothetical protein
MGNPCGQDLLLFFFTRLHIVICTSQKRLLYNKEILQIASCSLRFPNNPICSIFDVVI